ncbi:hypothetical protein [Modestobacter sp. SYSU DS0511]
MTEPNATEADRQEQEQIVGSGGPELADEVGPVGDGVPEADVIEQRLTAVPGGGSSYRGTAVEADEYDVLEQQAVVPDDEDDLRT